MVITDFGLARGVEGDNPLASISETGVVVGTAAYMAPEQVEGKSSPRPPTSTRSAS